MFKWYGDPDAMIAGFRNGEVDIATDLQDSDLPKVQDLGDQVSAIPALLYEFLRPNWSRRTPFDDDHRVGGCSRNPAVQDRGTGCPMADPAMREAVAYAIDKNEINTRLLGGNAQVANTNISPVAWFYADQTPATFDPEKAKQILEDGGWADSRRRRHPREGRPEGQDRALHDDPPGPPGHARAHQRLAEGRRHRQRHQPGRRRRTSSPTTTRPPPTPRASSSHSNFDLAEHAFSSSIDPLGNYFSYHSSQFRPDGANDAQVNDTGHRRGA